jgi:membrane protein
VTGLAGRARKLSDQALTAAGNHRALSVAVAVLRRDIEVGGTLLAGALGFRLFVWLLPCCLLAAAALGFTEATAKPPDELVHDLGMSPLTASMMGQLGQQAERGRYLTALIGFLLLLWAGLTLSRALDRVHDRVWHTRLDRGPKVTLARAGRYNLALVLVVAVNVAGPVIGAAIGRSTAVVSLPSLIGYAVLGMALLSPEWPVRWRTAWPGAALLAIGAEGLHLVAVLYLPGKLARASELYGALGVAASVLVWLALTARLLVLGQVLNAVLADRRAG